MEDLSHDEAAETLEVDSMSDKGEVQIITIEEEVDQSGSEAGRKRKQEDRTPSSQVLKEDSKRAKDDEQEEVCLKLLLLQPGSGIMNANGLVIASRFCCAFGRHG